MSEPTTDTTTEPAPETVDVSPALEVLRATWQEYRDNADALEQRAQDALSDAALFSGRARDYRRLARSLRAAGLEVDRLLAAGTAPAPEPPADGTATEPAPDTTTATEPAP